MMPEFRPTFLTPPISISRMASSMDSGTFLPPIPLHRASSEIYRFEYKKHSVRCPPTFSWYEMYFARGHIGMDCDPKVRAEVETLIRKHLPE
jgi:hypothetical protein